MELIEATDADFAALIAGSAPRALALPGEPPEPPEAPGVLAMLRDLAATIRPAFAPAAWMMVVDGEIVGLCSLVKPPATGLDIGYGVAPGRRRRGHGAAAVAALLAWARADARVAEVCAETSVGNRPSQRVLEANGFARVGERTDPEDGALILWRAPA